VRDLVKGIVQQEDVLCIIARTHMLTDDHVKTVVGSYLAEPTYLYGLDKHTCETVALELFHNGKILEPRANGIGVMKVPREYVWMDLFPTVAELQNEGVRHAWESYRMLIGLTEQLPEHGEESVYRHSEKLVQHELTAEETKDQKKAIDLLIRHMV